MKDTELLQVALGLVPPWMVNDCTFAVQEKQLDIHIDFSRGGAFTCPVCGRSGCNAYDTKVKKWRHLNFFEHVTYLHVRTPRIKCPNCGVKGVSVPWARAGSGFTLMFEAFVMVLAKEMPINAIARLVGEEDTRIWRILHHYVQEARAGQDYSEVRQIGVDETASKRGHNYISVFVDMETSKVLFSTEGKDAKTISTFREDLEAHGGDADQIKEVCCDMSPAFISGIEGTFEQAAITFDKFHMVKIVNNAVDEVRRQEQRIRPELIKTRYHWLKNPENLTRKQKEKVSKLQMKTCNLKTARAYQIKLVFQEFYQQPIELAEAFLKKWYFWSTHSRLQPIIDAAHTIKRHWEGVLRWVESRITNGVLEGINGLIQAAKDRARGFRSTKNLITMAYLIAGKLKFNLPT